MTLLYEFHFLYSLASATGLEEKQKGPLSWKMLEFARRETNMDVNVHKIENVQSLQSLKW